MNVRPSLASTLPLFLLGALALTTAGCGKEYVRGSEHPGIDSPAMSTGLDKRDIQGMLTDCLNDLRSAPIMNEWRSKNGSETVAVFPFQNGTTEHLESSLDAILDEAENWLVQSAAVKVIARDKQAQMIADVEGARNPVFNPANAVRYGKQLGTHYYITGKIQAADERTDDARRVQYFMFLQVIEVETSAIRWSHKAYVTKAIH